MLAFMWGLFRIVSLFFAVVISALVILDGTLLANILKKQG